MPDPINQQLPDPQASVDNALSPEPQVAPVTPTPTIPPVPEPVVPEIPLPEMPSPVEPTPSPMEPMPSSIPVGDDTPLAFVKETQASIPPEQPMSSSAPPAMPPPPEMPKKKGMGKIMAVIAGVVALVGGLGAFGYYYFSTPPQISNVNEWDRARCEEEKCSPAGYEVKWTTLRGCIATETRCGSAAPAPDPTSCEEKNKDKGGAECLAGNPSIGENCVNLYSRVNREGNCYRANQICCSKATNTGGSTGGGTGYINDGNNYCNSSGCNVGSAYPNCVVTHYKCQQSGVAGCNETTVANRVQSASFTENCGTEQIDVTCQLDSHWVCSTSDKGKYSSKAICDQYCADLGEGDCTQENTPTQTHAGSSSKNYGNDCREPSSPRPSDRATPTPTPSAAPTMACTALTRVPTTTPEVGDTLTFTCAGRVRPTSAGTLSYKFRYSLNSGAFAALANTTATTAELEIDACGAYQVQCQACATLNGKLTCDPVWTGATQ